MCALPSCLRTPTKDEQPPFLVTLGPAGHFLGSLIVVSAGQQGGGRAFQGLLIGPLLHPIMAEALLDATYANPGWMNGKTNYLVFRSRPSEGRAKPGLGLPALAECGVRTKAYQGCVPRRVPVGRCLEGGREGICLR